jgi:CheY-like chemotaxis protein
MANILIVDDDVDAVDLCRDLLESAGHQVQTGHTGMEGLKSLKAGPLPDCVLLDVDMPVLNGPGMAHEMLLHDAGEEQIPILLVSGSPRLSVTAARVGTLLPGERDTPLWQGSHRASGASTQRAAGPRVCLELSGR